MKLSLIFSFALLTLFNTLITNSAEFVQLNHQTLAEVKASLDNKTSSELTLKAYQQLIKHSDSLLNVENYSVIDKTILAPTNNPHDYLSISRYWWPDATKEDGLPWVRRDGETNPDTQTDKVDRPRIGAMTNAVRDLSYAYYFSGDEKYAQKGVELIQTWFLNEKTKMNPHLNFAQSVPGINKSRRSGILDGRLIPLKVLDSITLFSPSKHWSNDDNDAMNKWLTEYLTWLTNSKLGKKGAQQTNNHGSWYRFQVTALAFYLGKDKILKRQLRIAKTAMAAQFNEQGAQEHELKRTKSYFYSTFNLNAITRIAIIADKAGDSLWNYPSTEEGELERAINYLIPAAKGESWPHPTKGINTTDFIESLSRYSAHTGSAEHKILLRKLLSSAQAKATHGNREGHIINTTALFNPSAFD